ncbi:centromere protein F-like isoform X4 [Wyeomyia smithii]|uniref:centromere protein F-like isoform X4 n=1 Tax=Wyeomyia smithii TaxID=174621 RepID=UPI0024682191|nr:centromere protein F-like isoform X4 [Wyeomyia smithii]
MDNGPESPSVKDGTPTALAAEEISPARRCPQEGGDCGTCGEPRQLTIGLAEKINQVFENRLRLVEQETEDPRYKIKVYQDWVRELRSINIGVVEAIKAMQDSCQRQLSRMSETYKRNLTRFGPETQARLMNDRDGLVEVIRRAHTSGRWDIEGIHFLDLSIDDIFGKKTEGDAELNPVVPSNCPTDELLETDIVRRESMAEQKNIDELQFATELAYSSEECDVCNRDCLQNLRQHISQKNDELEQKTLQIDCLCKQIETMKSNFENAQTISQPDSEQSRSLIENKIEDLNEPNWKMLQHMQNLVRVKSDQMEALLRENETLRAQVAALNAQLNSQSNVDNQSLVNEISIHYDENRRLKQKLLDIEQSLNEANVAIRHRNTVIAQLRQEIQLQKKNTMPIFDSNGSSLDSMSLCSSESVTSFGSAHSGSSTDTVVKRTVSPAMRTSLDRLTEVSELETEQLQHLKEELAEMGTRLVELQSIKQSQDEIIAQQCDKLQSTESEYRILRDEYENNEKRLAMIRTEIVRLIKVLRETTKDHFPLPQISCIIEELVPQTVFNLEDAPSEIFENDSLILESLQQHLNSITRHYLLTIAEQKELKRDIAALQHDKRKQDDLIENLNNGLLVAKRASLLDSQRVVLQAEPSRESTESFAAQRMQMQNALRAVAEEIAYLLGNDLPDDTLSSFSELDATPLHCLIENLKQEIEAKDSLLQRNADIIGQLEQAVSAKEQELYRVRLRQDSVERERLSYNKRIENLQRALRDHDETIGKLKQQNHGLEQQLDDMKETLNSYKENIQRTIEEKGRVEDECKNQLVTISNLRTALEETKRNSSSSVNHLKEVIETLQSQVSMLSEQLNHAFRENLTKDTELDQYRDSNLQLRCQISELTCDSIELKDLVALLGTKRELEEQKQRHVQQMKNELNSLQAQMVDVQKEIISRQRDRDYLSYFRKKCAEMDAEHQQELQRMRDEIESLSVQLGSCNEQTIQHEQWLQESNELQNTVAELETHNDILQKAMQSYGDSIEQLQQELSAMKFQIGKLKGKNSNLEQCLSHKEDLIERLQQNLRDVNQRLAAKSETAHNMETKNANLSQLLEKFREDSTVREKKLTEELNSIRRSSQDHKNQLQHCENQLVNYRKELETLREKADDLLKERDTLRQQAQDFGEKLECSAGKESALCEVLKKLEEEVSFKSKRLAEVEADYREIYQAYQHLKGFNEDLVKQSQITRIQQDNYRKLVEFKRQTLNTLELGRKCAEESRNRERVFQQRIEEQKRMITKLKEDRIKIMGKLYEYHRDSVILTRKLEDYHHMCSESHRTISTSLHQQFYPEAYKLVRSNSDPVCRENDELFRKMEFTSSRIQRTRQFWQQGMREILAPK